jgi:outer membrane immunogenic protein
MIKALSIGMVLAGVIVAPSMAADLAVYKAPPVFSWTGCYVGATAGGIEASSTDTWAPNPAGFTIAGHVAAITSATAATEKASGFTGGGELGCNYQWSPWLVLGVEGDIQAAQLSFGRTGVVTVPSTQPFNETFTSHWFSTVRARAGVAYGEWLFFGTAGVAFADATYTDSISFPTSGTINSITGSNTATGWTAGGGIEWAFARQWSIKGEYLYVNVGGMTLGSANSAPTTFPFSTIAHVHGNLTENVGRIGLNYKFW